MWRARQRQHQSATLSFTGPQGWRLPWPRVSGRLPCPGSPRLLFPTSSAFPNSSLTSAGQRATQIKHLKRPAGTFLLFIVSLCISFSLWKQVRVLHHRRWRITVAPLGGFTTSPSSVPSARSLQLLLDQTFTSCQSVFPQLPL